MSSKKRRNEIIQPIVPILFDKDTQTNDKDKDKEKKDTDTEKDIERESLDVYDDRYDRIWKQTRNPIRVGRIIRAILTSAKETVTDQEIEEFVNQFKSSWDIMNDAFLKFDIVSGKDIAYWYNYERYESRDSTLGSSCMSDVPDKYFKIYTKNPEVCQLVVLFIDV